MRTLNLESFNELLKNTDIKSRIKADLKFVKSIEGIADDWSDYELISISDRSNNKGILLLEPEDELFVVQYELSRKIIDFKTGRSRAIVCDFCYTWQSGSNAASILFSVSNTKSKIGFLCCGDLRCSQHVRSLTKAGIVSRTQLRENMTNEDRVVRLKNRLRDKIAQLKLTKIHSSS